jgi:hypothetical protein
MFGLTSCEFIRLDLHVLFRLYLKLQVEFCFNSSWNKNQTYQNFHSFMVCLETYLNKKERHV